MKAIEFQCRPIERWPRALTKSRKRSQFNSLWGVTLRLLDTELRHLRATAVCLHIALRAEDIRLDGRPRANAKPEHPGVILSCNTPQGPRQFPCDKFDDWSDNVRAIALALEALRKVDRYGVTVSGEQYTGFAALPPPNGDHWDQKAAVEWLAVFTGIPKGGVLVTPQIAIRQAEMQSHPDRGGNPDDFKKVQRCRQLLLGGAA